MPKIDRENTLMARWSKKEDDVLFSFPRKVDGHLLSFYFGHLKPRQLLDSDPEPKTFFEELEARGYDLKTLRFSIKRKRVTPEQ
jgi:hypothetical protein